jgi:hypothetical protein
VYHGIQGTFVRIFEHIEYILTASGVFCSPDFVHNWNRNFRRSAHLGVFWATTNTIVSRGFCPPPSTQQPPLDKSTFFFRGLLPPPPPIRQYRRTKVRHFFLFINQLTTTKVTTTLENEQIFEVIFPSITAHQMTTPHQPAPSNRARMLVSRLPTHHNHNHHHGRMKLLFRGLLPTTTPDCPPDTTSVRRCAPLFSYLSQLLTNPKVTTRTRNERESSIHTPCSL